jgi:ribosomal protein L18
MSKNKFINIENPDISAEYTTNNLIIQIINASKTIKDAKAFTAQKQKLKKQVLTSENTNILNNHIKIKDNITVEM